MDIFGAVEMAIWLNTHVYYGNSAGDLVSSHSEEEEADEIDTIIRQTKSYVAGKVNSKLISVIFGRIREILMKDVERFVGKAEDFIPRVSHTQSETKIVDDGTNLRLEKALGLGIQAAYSPVKTACRLLVLVHDCTFEYGGNNVSSKLFNNKIFLLTISRIQVRSLMKFYTKLARPFRVVHPYSHRHTLRLTVGSSPLRISSFSKILSWRTRFQAVTVCQRLTLPICGPHLPSCEFEAASSTLIHITIYFEVVIFCRKLSRMFKMPELNWTDS